jgi:hypothetical protein
MAGTEYVPVTTGFLPFDNSTLRARLAERVVETRSIEAELRAAMAAREVADEGTKRKPSRWQ